MALWNIPALASLEADHERETGEYRFESLVAFASSRGVVLPEPDLDDPSNYFEGSQADITGLIGVIEQGCGHMTAVAIQPPDVGRVVTVGGDGGVWETDRSFDEVYDHWLNGLITTYSDLIDETSGGVRMDTIRSLDGVPLWFAVDRLASLHGIARPTLSSGNEINAWCVEMLEHFETLSPVRPPSISEP